MQHAGNDLLRALPGTHQVEIVVRLDIESLQHLVEHLPVLPGHRHAQVEAGVAAELFYHRRHFNRLRPGAEHGQTADRIHIIRPFSRRSRVGGCYRPGWRVWDSPACAPASPPRRTAKSVAASATRPKRPKPPAALASRASSALAPISALT